MKSMVTKFVFVQKRSCFYYIFFVLRQSMTIIKKNSKETKLCNINKSSYKCTITKWKKKSSKNAPTSLAWIKWHVNVFIMWWAMNQILWIWCSLLNIIIWYMTPTINSVLFWSLEATQNCRKHEWHIDTNLFNYWAHLSCKYNFSRWKSSSWRSTKKAAFSLFSLADLL
jgi:hypothetical protein